jgi:prepilin-type N-terminal cleavage/methylation domain-containing protein
MGPSKSGLTLIEVLVAVALSTFIAAIGFTGIQAYAKSIMRAREMSAQTQLISIMMVDSIKQADAYQASLSSSLTGPTNWPALTTDVTTIAAGRAVLTIDQTKHVASFVGKGSGKNPQVYAYFVPMGTIKAVK